MSSTADRNLFGLTVRIVAELGATFLCADLGITDEPRAECLQPFSCRRTQHFVVTNFVVTVAKTSHHTRQVQEINPGQVTRLADLALVCATETAAMLFWALLVLMADHNAQG
jgi:hypothetical protein